MDRGAWRATVHGVTKSQTHWRTKYAHTRTHIHAFLCYWAMNSCLTLCDLMDCSTPGLRVPYHCPKFAQTHVCWVGDAIQQSHPLSFPFSSCPQSFLKSVFSNGLPLCIRWPKYWSFSISPSSDYSGFISFRMDWFVLACTHLCGPFGKGWLKK